MDEDIISDEEVEAGNIKGDELFGELLDEINEGDEDAGTVAYCLWVNLSRLLAEQGWTVEQLSVDLCHHMTDQMTEGRG